MDLFLDSQFYSTGLYVYPFASTTLLNAILKEDLCGSIWKMVYWELSLHTETLVERAIRRQSPKAMGAVLGFSSGDGDMGRYLGAFLEPELAELGQIWIQQVKK